MSEPMSAEEELGRLKERIKIIQDLRLKASRKREPDGRLNIAGCVLSEYADALEREL